LQNVYAISDAQYSTLGNSTDELLDHVKKLHCGITLQVADIHCPTPYWAALLSSRQKQNIAEINNNEATFFEKMCIAVVQQALDSLMPHTIKLGNTLLILSSTKGNIAALDKIPDDKISLYHSANIIARHFNLTTEPWVVSNACISGSVALIIGTRALQQQRYSHVIVVGCDQFSHFIHSGFQSFHAVADGPCKPFDIDRTGISLGEAAACIILSNQKNINNPLARLSGGGITNDANHLSGPSRTGAELATAIEIAVAQAQLSPNDINLISAHGTATAYNDEMESKALYLAAVSEAPLHSLKSYIGHTLGAAGIIESILAYRAMNENIIPASLGYTHNGVPHPVKITATTQQASAIQHVLKTASGFGGCNAALVWSKCI
jgi:3-oxoacyl-[acyl-carrier-protein] synthase-1